MRKSILACLASAAILALAGCGPSQSSSSSSQSPSESPSVSDSPDETSYSSSSSSSSSSSTPEVEVSVEITAAPEGNLTTGGTFTFQAKVTNSTEKVVWSIECDPSDMGAAIDSATGVLTVGDKPGTITVKATVGDKSDSVTVTVVEGAATYEPIPQALLDEAGKGVKSSTTLTSQYVGSTPSYQYYETISSPSVVYYAYAYSLEGLSNPSGSNRYENHEGVVTTVELGIDNKPAYTNLLALDPYIEDEYTNLSWADSGLGSVFSSLKSEDFITADGVNYSLNVSTMSQDLQDRLVLTFLPTGDEAPLDDSWKFEYLSYDLEAFSLKVTDGKLTGYSAKFKDVESSWGDVKQLSFEGTIEETGEGLISPLTARTNTIPELEDALAELKKGNFVAEFDGTMNGSYASQALKERVTTDGSSIKVEALTGQGAKFDYGYVQSGNKYAKLTQAEDESYQIADIQEGSTAQFIPTFGFSSVFFTPQAGTTNVYDFNFSLVLYTSLFYISDDAFPLSANYVDAMSIKLEDNGNVVISMSAVAEDMWDDAYDITITYSQIGEVTELYPEGSIPDVSLALTDSMLQDAAQGIHLKSELYEQDVVEGETPEADVNYYETFVSSSVNVSRNYYSYGFDYASPEEIRYENHYAEASLPTLGLTNEISYEPLLVEDETEDDGYAEMYWSDSGLKNIFSELAVSDFTSEGDGKYSLNLDGVSDYVKSNLGRFPRPRSIS